MTKANGLFKLKQPKQCQTCPWRKDSKLKNIFNYDPNLHCDLESTIADEANLYSEINSPVVEVMACHHSKDDDMRHCIGWLENQLIRNNIALRLAMRNCTNLRDMETFGEQYETFQETLPDNREDREEKNNDRLQQPEV